MTHIPKKTFLKLKNDKGWTPYIEKDILNFKTMKRKLLITFKEAISFTTKINPDEVEKFGIKRGAV
jgi:hypothetical protein